MLVLIEPRWRLLMAPSGRVLACGLYKHPHGVELRCGYDGDDAPVRTRLEPSVENARQRATDWLDAIKAKGSCEELPLDAS